MAPPSILYFSAEKARNVFISAVVFASLPLPESSLWSGKTLAQLRIGGSNGVHLAAIVRGQERINVPGGQAMLFPHDIIEVVGADETIELFRQRMNAEVQKAAANASDAMEIQCITVLSTSPLCGKLIKESGIRDKYGCLVVGFEDKRGNMRVAGADHIILQGEKLWLAGSHESLSQLNKVLSFVHN